jgi:hypothetical protein
VLTSLRRKTLATCLNLGKDIAPNKHTMICEHLKPLEQAIHARGIKETSAESLVDELSRMGLF